MKIILESLDEQDMHKIIIYPNNDPGNENIIEEIKKYGPKDSFHVFKNLSRKSYLSTMKHAHFMIGNSSSGIIESAIFQLPVINVGIRNLNRESSENVITTEMTKIAIAEAIKIVMSDIFRGK